MNDLIAKYPQVVAWLLASGLTLISTLFAIVSYFAKQRINFIEETAKTLREEVGELKVNLEGQKSHAGAGDKMLEEVKAGIAGLSAQLGNMQKENLTAHALIGERLVRVETRMPNGELVEALSILRELKGRI